MIRVVSLFAGIGNADAGLYAAAAELGVEVEVVLAVDSWEKVVNIYNRNMPHASAIVADVKQMTRFDLPDHDLIIGGPPCQPFSLSGKRLGALRLSDRTPYLMENVVSRLIPSVPFSVKLNAFDFGDVTTRKRWFYSSHLLRVIETPGPLRFGDIRDHEADRIAIAKRFGDAPANRKKGDTRGGRSDVGEKVGTYADALSSLTAHAWHGRYVRSNIKMVNVKGRGRKGTDKMTSDGACGSFTGSSSHSGKIRPAVGMRPYPQPYRIIGDGDGLGSITSWHGNEISRPGPLVRCPSLLEMARAHSIPDDFDFCGATKTDRGKMIANSWPRGMAKAVCKAMLVAMSAT